MYYITLLSNESEKTAKKKHIIEIIFMNFIFSGGGRHISQFNQMN